MKLEDYFEYYIQGSDHYLIPKDVFTELFNEMINWKEESKKQKEVIDKAIEYIRIYRSYQKIDNKDYLKGRDEIGCLDIYQVDELLDILNEGKNEWDMETYKRFWKYIWNI